MTTRAGESRVPKYGRISTCPGKRLRLSEIAAAPSSSVTAPTQACVLRYNGRREAQMGRPFLYHFSAKKPQRLGKGHKDLA